MNTRLLTATLVLLCAGFSLNLLAPDQIQRDKISPFAALSFLKSVSQSQEGGITEEILKWIKFGFTTLTQAQMSNVEIILDQAKTQGLTDKGQIAYIIATALIDSGIVPRKELRAPIGTQEREIQDGYWFTGYYGRGFTTLKFKEKYAEFGTKLKLALVSNPDLALDPTNAARILVYGMKNGTFTGKKLSEFIFEDMQNFKAARSVVQSETDDGKIAAATLTILDNEELSNSAAGLLHDTPLTY